MLPPGKYAYGTDRQTDRQTDGKTDRSTDARPLHYAFCQTRPTQQNWIHHRHYMIY